MKRRRGQLLDATKELISALDEEIANTEKKLVELKRERTLLEKKVLEDE